MIFIGTMEWASTRMRGMFHCPTCASTQKFRLRASRPFLTIYFIPVVPIGGLQEFVQCGNCKNAFETMILSNRMMPSDATPGQDPTAAGLPGAEALSFEQDLVRVIALMMVEDGQVTENEISIARRLFSNITEENLSREELGKVCSAVRLHRLTTSSFLATCGPRRSHEEKLLLVQAMFGVAGADGEITPGRMQSLLQAQQILGLEEREFETAVKNTEQWLT